jgi:tetratricopeptide (TPR) repeat protein
MVNSRTVDSSRRHAAPAPLSPCSSERLQMRAAELAEELARAYQRGERPRAEDALAAAGAEFAEHPDAACVIVLEEIRQRRAAGPEPTLVEFLARFPLFETEVRRAFAEEPAGPAAGPDFPGCGETLAGCRLVAELGRGVEGRVFLAVQDDLAGRPLALKVGPCAGREHLTLARLLHTHIVPLYFVQNVPDRDVRVLAMPYLGGASLARVLDELADVPPPRRTGRDVLAVLDRLQAGVAVPVPSAGPARAQWARSSYADAVCWTGACLADAMHYAHQRGLLHLDLKPENVLLAADGQPLLLDFHLARAPLPAGGLPLEAFGGTPGYMAPEQRLAFESLRASRPLTRAVDGRADLYSLAMVLYKALGGEPPEPGERPLPLFGVNPAVGRGLSDVLDKCLEADPARRYADAGLLADDLRRHVANLPLHGVGNHSLAERWQKWRRRRPHALAVGLLTTAVFAAMTGLFVILGALFLGRHRDARAALEEGRECLLHGRPDEAERVLSRGLERVEGLPGGSALAGQLRDERREARRHLLAREFQAEADRVRFLGDPELLSPGAAGKVADRCERLWGVRAQVWTGPDGEERLRTDLLDLAVLGARHRVRAAPAARKEEARRRALAVLDEAEQLAGPGPALSRERAAYLAALGDADGAAAACREAAAAPRSAWDQYALGRVLLDTGELADAAEALAAAVRERPDAFWPNFYQGVCAHRRGRHAEAVEAFRACIALAPDAAPCYCDRGLALTALGRDADARSDFDRALDLNPHLAQARLGRAALALKQVRPDDAEPDLHRALADGADPAAVHYDLALVCLARRDQAGARAALQTCLEHRPDHAAARELLKRIGP